MGKKPQKQNEKYLKKKKNDVASSKQLWYKQHVQTGHSLNWKQATTCDFFTTIKWNMLEITSK